MLSSSTLKIVEEFVGPSPEHTPIKPGLCLGHFSRGQTTDSVCPLLISTNP